MDKKKIEEKKVDEVKAEEAVVVEPEKKAEPKPVEKKKFIHSLTLVRPTLSGERAYTVGEPSKDGICLELLRHDGCWSIKCTNMHILFQGEGQAALKTVEVLK